MGSASIYRNLGDLYLEKERFQDAAQTYESFVEQDPLHPKSPLLQVEVIESYTAAIAKRLDVQGLINVQYAVVGTTVYVIEANPRASRTVPFVAKATGVPLAKVAARCMAGKTLAEQGYLEQVRPDFVAVKESVFPFAKFQGVDPILGPEMKSTGEVMGIGRSFPEAFAKGLLAAGTVLPRKGRAFLSVRDPDKDLVVELAQVLFVQISVLTPEQDILPLLDLFFEMDLGGQAGGFDL